MPLRGLLYFARNYQAYIDRNHLDIYSSVLQRIPLPQYIVFLQRNPGDAGAQNTAPVRCLSKTSREDSLPVL